MRIASTVAIGVPVSLITHVLIDVSNPMSILIGAGAASALIAVDALSVRSQSSGHREVRIATGAKARRDLVVRRAEAEGFDEVDVGVDDKVEGAMKLSMAEAERCATMGKNNALKRHGAAMRQVSPANALVLLAALLSSCSSMPKVTVSHYLPAASLAIVVTQTATCTGEGIPIIVDAVVMTASYRADKKVDDPVNLAKLGTGVTKADATFEFFPDGRLKSVNSKQTGQAGAALGSLFELVSSAAVATPTKSEIDESCGAIKALVGDGKALTIVSRGSTNFEGAIDDLRQTSVPTSLFNDKLRKIFGTLAAEYSVGPVSELLDAGVDADCAQGLTLRKTAPITVTVSIQRDGKAAQYSEIVVVPQRGEDQEYKLPIQKGPWFGENTFELALHDSGSVTKLRYGGGGDAGAVVAAFSDAHTAFNDEPVSTADKAKAVQAEADLIYQQQRLVLCQANPATCSK